MNNSPRPARPANRSVANPKRIRVDNLDQLSDRAPAAPDIPAAGTKPDDRTQAA